MLKSHVFKKNLNFPLFIMDTGIEKNTQDNFYHEKCSFYNTLLCKAPTNLILLPASLTQHTAWHLETTVTVTKYVIG